MVDTLPQMSRRAPGGAHRLRRRYAEFTLALTALLASTLLSAGPAQANADKSGVTAVTTQTAPLAPGQSAWLAVVWTADQTVTNWSTTVTPPPGVTVSYPTTRGGSDTSLYGSATLVGTTKDFTAFKLKVPYTQTGSFTVVLQSTYTLGPDNGNGNRKGNGPDNGNGNGNGKTYVTSAAVTVPIQAATGPAFRQKTTMVSIQAGSNTFQQVAFAGGQSDLANFNVRLGALPAGLEVAYPGDKSSSGLNGDSTLIGGSTDYAGIRFIATDLKPGTYTIPVTVSYIAASPQTATGTLTLVVT